MDETSEKNSKKLSLYRSFSSPEIRLQAKRAYLEGATVAQLSEQYSMPELAIRHYIATEWGAEKWALAKSAELDRIIEEAPRATKRLRDNASALSDLIQDEITLLAEAGPSRTSATQIRRLTESLSQLSTVLEKSTGFTELAAAATHDSAINDADPRPTLGSPVINVVVNPPTGVDAAREVSAPLTEIGMDDMKTE